MNKRSKNIDTIRNLITDLPTNFQIELEYVIKKIHFALDSGSIIGLNGWLHKYIYDLPLNSKWKRRHIYLLVHELLNNEFNSDLEDILYNVESGIIGDCSIANLKHYASEPSTQNEFVTYIRNYDWV